ncbi:MAG: hypothetical protein ACO1N0_05975 [Fluviicola sp.]
MKNLISILSFVLLSNVHAQTPPNGAIKFGFVQKGEVVFLKERIAVKYINEKTHKLILDTLYFNPESPVPAKVFPPGNYKMEIRVTNLPTIQVRNITVFDQRVTFITAFDLDKLKDRKKTVKLKYERPKNKYQSCG